MPRNGIKEVKKGDRIEKQKNEKKSVRYIRIATGDKSYLSIIPEKNAILLKPLNEGASQRTSSGYVDGYDDKRNCHLNVPSRIVPNS